MNEEIVGGPDQQDAQPKPASCREEPGVFVPLIDRGRCEGKAACVAVCPVGVFRMEVLSPQDKSQLPVFARFRAWVHGNRQAFAVHAESCQACGLCVRECPEEAITLVRAGQN